MSASAGGVMVIPGLLFLLALVLLVPGPLRMFGGAVLMLVILSLFWMGARSGGRVEVEAVAPARIERAVPVVPAPPPVPVQVPVAPPPQPPPPPPPVQVPVPVPEPEVVVPE